MRISKASLVRPGANEVYGIFALALSLFVFAYSARFGQVSILAYYGLWLPLVLVDYRKVLGNYASYLWIFAFTIFACITIFWSAAPSLSLRTGIQYLSHVVCALIAMRTIDIRTLTRGMIAGAAIVLLYSLLFGTYHYDPLDGTYSFVGAFASKNQLGFYASLGIYFAFAAVFVLGEKGLWMGAAGGAGLLAAYCLLTSQSATSVLTTAAVIGLCLGMRAITALRPASRKLLFIAASVFGGVAAVAMIYAGGVDLILDAFGRIRRSPGAPISGSRASRRRRCRHSSASAIRPIGCRVSPRPSGYGRSSISVRAPASISTTPSSKRSSRRA